MCRRSICAARARWTASMSLSKYQLRTDVFFRCYQDTSIFFWACILENWARTRCLSRVVHTLASSVTPSLFIQVIYSCARSASLNIFLGLGRFLNAHYWLCKDSSCHCFFFIGTLVSQFWPLLHDCTSSLSTCHDAWLRGPRVQDYVLLIALCSQEKQHFPIFACS